MRDRRLRLLLPYGLVDALADLAPLDRRERTIGRRQRGRDHLALERLRIGQQRDREGVGAGDGTGTAALQGLEPLAQRRMRVEHVAVALLERLLARRGQSLLADLARHELLEAGGERRDEAGVEHRSDLVRPVVAE